jgi:hypothetical protein
MSEEQDKRVADILAEVFDNIALPNSITRKDGFVLEINISTTFGPSVISYDLFNAAKWMIDKYEEEFANYLNKEGEADEDYYFSLYNAFVVSPSISAIEIIIQQLPAEFEDLIQTLPELANTLNECISNEYSKQMFAKGEFPKQSDNKEIVNKFVADSAKKRKERMMRPINDIKEESKPDLKQMAIHYERLLPIWSEAKRLFKQVSNKGNWVDVIKLAYQVHDLPEDLIQRLSTLDNYEAPAYKICLEHSARLCEVPPNTYQWRRLNDFLNDSRELHGLSAK